MHRLPICLLASLWLLPDFATSDASATDKQKNKNKKPPNILLLLADDLGYGEVEGYFPGTLIQTPYLTRLQQQGMKFTDFYSGEAVCAPARCTLFTGKHTGHATVRGNRKGPDGYDYPLQSDPNDITIPQLLKAHANYRTAMVGKWCFGGENSHASPWKKGFDYFFGHLQQAAAHNMYPRYLWERPEQKQAKKIWFPQNNNATRLQCMKPNNTCQYAHSLFVEKAIQYMEEYARQQSTKASTSTNGTNDDPPFFLFVSFTIPHAGGYTSDWKEIGNPVPTDGRYTDQTTWPNVERDHAAVITEYLDRDVGRLLNKLDQLGLADNTLVLFSSDNGPHNEGGHDVTFFNSSGHLRGYKRSLYEGGIRVPFLVKWPAGHIQANVTTQQVGWFPDLYPTLAQVAGIPLDQIPPNDGESLLGVWTESSPTPKKDCILYWEFCTPHNGIPKWGQAVRQGDWKLISLDRGHAAVQTKGGDGVGVGVGEGDDGEGEGTPWELYNLKQDPGETNNLAAINVLLVQKLAFEAQKAHRDDPNWPTGRSCVPSDSFERSISFAMDFS